MKRRVVDGGSKKKGEYYCTTIVIVHASCLSNARLHALSADVFVGKLTCNMPGPIAISATYSSPHPRVHSRIPLKIGMARRCRVN